MDSKALAKSKRVHSLHHSKKQPNKPKAASGSVSNAGPVNKNIGKQARERARQSGLPSNWDRYEDEFDSASDDVVASVKESDVVLPKSKGADYRYLIAEAQSQSQCQSDFYSDDVLLGELSFGLGPMLSVRGEGILSWIEDDNFVEEDDAAVNSEAHFLSLNLNALAEQLAKVDISKRLFIEADLLPLEQSGHETKVTSSSESDQMQTSKNQLASTVSEDSASKGSSSMHEISKHSSEVTATSGNHIIVNQTKNALDSSQDNSTGSRAPESNASSATDPKKEQSMLEPTSAEEELDMLLDSFNETKLLNSSGIASTTSPSPEKESSRAQPEQAQSITNSTKTPSTAINLDDALDDLLEETSNLSNQSTSYHSTIVKAPGSETQPSSSTQPMTKSKVLDDFDSWFDTL